MAYRCKSCGGEEPIQDGVPCSLCGRRDYSLNAEAGKLEGKGFPVGMVLEGDPNNHLGRRVENRPASGGKADSSIAADGSFQASLTGNLDLGRSGEPHVIKVLANRLRELGHNVRVGGGARDDLGEDGILFVNEHRIPLQIVTVPSDRKLWKELHLRKKAAVSGALADAVSHLRQALVAKSKKASGALLALDLTQIGVLANSNIVDEYLASFKDPADEFSFKSVWLVGPTTSLTIKLSTDMGSV